MNVRNHTFTVNPEDNGGEQFTINTTIRKHGGDDNAYMTHQFVLQSYGSSAIIHISAQITPNMLRQWANELDEILAKMKGDEVSCKSECLKKK